MKSAFIFHARRMIPITDAAVFQVEAVFSHPLESFLFNNPREDLLRSRLPPDVLSGKLPYHKASLRPPGMMLSPDCESRRCGTSNGIATRLSGTIHLSVAIERYVDSQGLHSLPVGSAAQTSG
jgi:hypothetical protein